MAGKTLHKRGSSSREQWAGIVLAAGKGTRMKSPRAKVLHPLGGLPMISYPIQALAALGVHPIVVVVGHQAEAVEAALSGWPGLRTVRQYPQLGTAHAVGKARPLLAGFRGPILILSGDVPLIPAPLLKRFMGSHLRRRAGLSVLTTRVPDPRYYGRILRDRAGKIARIVEAPDADAVTREIREINAGIYAADPQFLFALLAAVKKNPKKGEYYLTEIIRLAAERNRPAQAFLAEDYRAVLGINTREELRTAERIKQNQMIEKIETKGGTVPDPDSIRIEATVKVDPGVVIQRGVTLRGRTRIGRGAVLEEGVIISDSRIGPGARILPYSVITGSQVGPGAQVGPFTHLRPGSRVGGEARIGNFVELKKTRIGSGSKASHLSYLGDAVIGRGVNVGAGTITCNYDGQNKHVTRIGDGVFIGSDTQLVAPVQVGRDAYIGAGSTITRDVPAGSLGISRGRQKNIPGYRRRSKAWQAAKADGEKEK